MSNKAVSDKSIVRNLILGCIAAILIFHFAWFSKFTHNLTIPVFAIIYGGLIAVFIVEAIGAYRYSDDDKKDWKRKFLLAITVAILAWLGGWAAGNNEKKMFEQDVEKAKQTSFIQQKKELFHIMTPEEVFIMDVIWLNNTAAVYRIPFNENEL
jgi:hypothetical protein